MTNKRLRQIIAIATVAGTTFSQVAMASAVDTETPPETSVTTTAPEETQAPPENTETEEVTETETETETPGDTVISEEELQSDIDSQTVIVEDKEKTLENAQKEVDDSKAALETAEKELNESREMLDEATAKDESLVIEKELGTDENISAVTEDINVKNNEIKENRDTAAIAETEKAEIEKSIETNPATAGITESINEKKTELLAKEDAEAIIKQNMENNSVAAENLKSEIAKNEKEILSINDKIASAQDQIEALKIKIAENETAISDKNSEIDAVKDAMAYTAGLQEQINALSAEIKTMKDTLKTKNYIKVPEGFTKELLESQNKDLIEPVTQKAFTDENTYISNEKDRSVMVDLDNISADMLLEINRFAVDLVNSVRQQVGLSDILLSDKSMEFSSIVARNYEDRKWDLFEQGHDMESIENALDEYGLLTSTENAGSMYNGESVRSLDTVKKSIYESVFAMFFNDMESDYLHGIYFLYETKNPATTPLYMGTSVIHNEDASFENVTLFHVFPKNAAKAGSPAANPTTIKTENPDLGKEHMELNAKEKLLQNLQSGNAGSGLQETLNNLNSELSALQSELATNNTVLKVKEKEFSDLVNDRSATETEIQAKQAEISAIQTENTKLNNDLSDITAEISVIKADIEDLQEQRASVLVNETKALNEITDKINALNMEKEVLDNELETLTVKLEKYKDFKILVEKSAEELAKAKADFGRESEEYTDAENRNKAAIAGFYMAKSEYDDAKAELDRLLALQNELYPTTTETETSTETTETEITTETPEDPVTSEEETSTEAETSTETTSETPEETTETPVTSEEETTTTDETTDPEESTVTTEETETTVTTEDGTVTDPEETTVTTETNSETTTEKEKDPVKPGENNTKPGSDTKDPETNTGEVKPGTGYGSDSSITQPDTKTPSGNVSSSENLPETGADASAAIPALGSIIITIGGAVFETLRKKK